MIESVQNKFIKEIYKLKDKKERKKQGLFLIEGERFVNQIPENVEVINYICTEEFLKKSSFKNLNINIVSENVMKKLSDTVTPQGIIAICKIKKSKIEDIKLKKDSLFLMLDRIMEPGNLGTIIRTADALNVDAIFLSKGCVDLYNSKVLRGTMGSIFNMSIIEDCDFEEIFKFLKSKNVKIIGTNLETEKSPFDVNLKEKVAIVFGNEANGVLKSYIDKCNETIKIPINKTIESFNVGVACGIVLYETLRQRIN